MKIERVRIREIRMRLREPFQISSGVSQDRRVLLVTLHSGGITAWGECVASETPAYSYETTDTAWTILTDLILPRVSGSLMESSADLLNVFEGIRGHRMAKAAVEMAAWDLEAKTRGASLASLVGGVRDSVPVGVSIGLQPTDDELHRKVAGYIGEGYARIKIKIKPGRDVAMLRGLRGGRRPLLFRHAGGKPGVRRSLEAAGPAGRDCLAQPGAPLPAAGCVSD